MGYSEALFLLLLALTLLFTDKKKWWLAAIAAGLASSTRFIGVFLSLVVIGTSLRGAWPLKNRSFLKLIGLGSLSIAGLFGYMVYLQIKFHDALAFVSAQQFWPGRGNGPGD